MCVVLQSLKAEFEQQQAILGNLEKLAVDYKAQGKVEAGARLEQQSSLLRVSRTIVTPFQGEYSISLLALRLAAECVESVSDGTTLNCKYNLTHNIELQVQSNTQHWTASTI